MRKLVVSNNVIQSGRVLIDSRKTSCEFGNVQKSETEAMVQSSSTMITRLARCIIFKNAKECLFLNGKPEHVSYKLILKCLRQEHRIATKFVSYTVLA